MVHLFFYSQFFSLITNILLFLYYLRCFPPEGQNVNIHKVIDFIHDKVKNALSVVSREEKNKSLQTLFKELNDHTANAFEFGKYFLAYLVSPSQKAGSNIVASKLFNGNTFETGRLTRLLEQTTNIVFETYVEDMDQTIKRLERKSNQALLATNHMMAIDNGAVGDKSVVIPNVLSAGYIIEITDYEESSYAIGTVLYVMEVCDPKAYRWVVKKAFSDFDRLHKAVIKDLPSALVEFLGLPAKAKKLINKKDDYERLSEELSQYLLRVLATIVQMNTASREVLATFLEVKHLILPDSQALRHAEHVPNVFVSLKEEFNAMLMGKNVRSNSVGSQSERKQVDSPNEKNSNQSKATKQMMEFRKTWGIEWAVKIFDAYAYLQRIATILGWTLEINHFFVSMFGNTLSFSKLPLREILITLKDIMANFLVVCEDLYKYACQLHAEAQYKWHKNLETTERNLSRIKHHVDKALATISLVECEHLDLEAQMRRLQDVHARFMPLMSRIDDNLGSIQHELGLPSTATNSLSQALEMERSNYQQLEGPRSAVPSYPPRIPKNITGSPETHAFVAFNSDYKQTVRIEEVDSDDGGKTGDYNDRCSGSNEEILKLGDEMNAAPKVLNRIRSSGNESRVLQGIAAANFKDSVLEHVENDSYHVPPVKDQVVGDSLVCTIC